MDTGYVGHIPRAASCMAKTPCIARNTALDIASHAAAAAAPAATAELPVAAKPAATATAAAAARRAGAAGATVQQ